MEIASLLLAVRSCAHLVDPDLLANIMMNLHEKHVPLSANMQIKDQPIPVQHLKLDEGVASRYKPVSRKSIMNQTLHPQLRNIARAAHMICFEKSEVHGPTEYLWTPFTNKGFRSNANPQAPQVRIGRRRLPRNLEKGFQQLELYPAKSKVGFLQHAAPQILPHQDDVRRRKARTQRFW